VLDGLRGIAVSYEQGRARPDPRLFLEARADLGAGLRATLMVGDEHDRDPQLSPDLRRCFDTTERRGHPAGPGGVTSLDLTVDIAHAAEPVRSWPETSRSADPRR
jgi:hypothetical protein